MDYKYYPKTLPIALQTSYNVKYAPSVLRTTMTDGTVRQRLLNTGAPSTISCTIAINSNADYKTFTDFLASIKAGAEWFVMPVLNEDSDDITATTCRLVRLQSGKYTSSLQFYDGLKTVRHITLTLDCDELTHDDGAWARYYAED